VRVKNVRFYRDGPWEKFDGNDTSVRPSSRAFSLSHSFFVSSHSLSLYLYLSHSLFLSLSFVRAYTYYNIVMYGPPRLPQPRKIRSNIMLAYNNDNYIITSRTGAMLLSHTLRTVRTTLLFYY